MGGKEGRMKARARTTGKGREERQLRMKFKPLEGTESENHYKRGKAIQMERQANGNVKEQVDGIKERKEKRLK